MLRKDIKQVICSLVSELDFYFEERGFKRRKNGLIYVRKVGTTIQKIDMVFFSNPSYYQNVLAHIYPHMEILFPNVNSTAKIFASKLIPEKWLDKFIYRFFTQQFKRSALPDGPKVGSISLSPRGDWRMPSDASFNSFK